jgi:hypothetical protein
MTGHSTAAGDGLYSLDTSWTITRPSAQNNTQAVTFDATGIFEGLGTPQTYVAIENSNAAAILRRSDTANIVPNGAESFRDIEVLPTGTLAFVAHEGFIPAGSRRVGEVVVSAGPTYTPQYSSQLASSRMSLVTGSLARLPAGMHVVDGGTRIVRLPSLTTAPEVVAESLTPGWVWVAAAVPSSAHPEGQRPAYLLLESNRGLGLDRVLALTPP